MSVQVGLAFAVFSTAHADEHRAPLFPRSAQQAILLEDPARRARPCLCQFGVSLKTGVLGYQLEQLLDPDDHGHHSYGEPAPTENNGHIYTCSAGFVDSTHLRAGVDWTAHLVVLLDRLTQAGGVVDLGAEGGGVRLVVRPAPHPLTREDILRLAQRAAHERLVWHEVMSWYYHPPTHTFSEQQSTFSPEDGVSNFLGTEVGRRAIELVEATGAAFEEAVDTAIEERLEALGAVRTADDTRRNFLAVDRNEDGLFTGEPWYDSDVVFWDQAYLFKRDIDVLSKVTAWRVPPETEVGCEGTNRTYSARVPRVTEAGTALTDLYEWHFTPERRFFREPADGPSDPRFVHDPLPELVTNRTLRAAIDQVASEMKDTLGDGFDRP